MHQRRSSIASDGRRLKVRLGDVKGFFTRWRNLIFWALMAVYAAAPLVQVNGQPLVLLDILHRRFFLFGETFNAQDAYLLWPFLAGGLLLLILVTATVGRVWCGYACPQTVFLEGLFRRIERLVEGPKHKQLQLAAAPWGGRKALLKGLKHGLYLLAALLVSHIFISYFVSLAELRTWVQGDPREHWVAFVWMGCITGLLYGNFAWFREQTCLILCPYGRLQSTLNDDDTVTVGYDQLRGEPRGKKGSAGAGDCIDCARCVDVCPTGIDIREGLQLECIACASCIDACDDIMRKVGRPTGLVRYASLNGLTGKPARILRPRLFVYLGLLAAFALAGTLILRGRHPFEATLIRQTNLPYVLEGGLIRNQYLLHVFNKTPHRSSFDISVHLPEGATALLPVPTVELDSLKDMRIPLVVQMPQAGYKGEFDVEVSTHDRATAAAVVSKLRFLGP
jgi:cytochrome c oxidase accessory protein FixG